MLFLHKQDYSKKTKLKIWHILVCKTYCTSKELKQNLNNQLFTGSSTVRNGPSGSAAVKKPFLMKPRKNKPRHENYARRALMIKTCVMERNPNLKLLVQIIELFRAHQVEVRV